MNEVVNSPLVSGAKAKPVKRISTRGIIKGYRAFGIDVSAFFKETGDICVYECEASSFRFYHPYVTGDSQFYEQLQEHDWYYMPWKWEHEVAKSYLVDGMSLLEVGCGNGVFLKAAADSFRLERAVGLELNQSVAGAGNKWCILNERIESYREHAQPRFDVVGSFQVLEHVSDVHGFLEASIACLKDGGTLLVSVPNNDAFIGKSESVLNKPPHHVGLWSPASLEYLEKIFPVKLIDMHFEPLQAYHVADYIHSMYSSPSNNLYGKVRRKLDRMTGRYARLKRRVESSRKEIPGHTVLAVFEKCS